MLWNSLDGVDSRDGLIARYLFVFAEFRSLQLGHGMVKAKVSVNDTLLFCNRFWRMVMEWVIKRDRRWDMILDSVISMFR